MYQLVHCIDHEAEFSYRRTNPLLITSEGVQRRTCYYFDREKQCLTELYDLWESTGYGWRQITERYLTAVDVQVADVYIIQQEEGTIHQQTPGSLVCIEQSFNLMFNFTSSLLITIQLSLFSIFPITAFSATKYLFFVTKECINEYICAIFPPGSNVLALIIQVITRDQFIFSKFMHVPGMLYSQVMDNLLDIFNLLDYVHHFDGCEKVLSRLLHMEDQNVSENSF